MEIQQETAIKTQFAKDILLLVDNKKNISQIAKELGLTYKSTFLNVKKLESANVLFLVDDKNSNSKIIKINPKIEESLKDILKKYELSMGTIKILIKDPENAKILKKFLNFYKNNRYANEEDLTKISSTNEEASMFGMLLALAPECGLLRERKELSRKGSILLSSIK